MLDGRHHLRKAQALAGMLPSEHAIKLKRRQCLCLEEKLERTLQLVVERVEHYNDRVPVQYVEVLKEFRLMTQKVQAFVVDCCYENENDFVLAAIRVTAHTGRFLQYYVELDWCLFLFECLWNGSLHGKPVYCQTLQEFDWEQKLRSFKTDTTKMVAADEGDLKAGLKSWIGKPGEHQAICWALLRRFEATAESDLHILPGNLEVPPITIPVEMIGRGGQGSVYEIKWKENSFAVKFFEIANAETINGEVKIMERCCHAHIVGLILAYKKGRKHYLMMERLPTDMQSYIDERKKDQRAFPFPHLEVVDMITQVCEAMLYLNDAERKVSHRDLKPKNILVKMLNSGMEEDLIIPAIDLQVCDFGMAKERMSTELEQSSTSNNTPNCGTRLFTAPEMIGTSGERIRGSSMKADMYSFAVTGSVILTGREPFGGYENMNMESKIKAIKDGARPDLPDNCPPALSTLLKRCWHPDPRRRPAHFSEILKNLRELKANLLTSAVDRTVTFNAGDRRLNILLLGDSSELVEAVVHCICGDGMPHTQVQGHESLTESRNSWPPMCLYSVSERINGSNFKAIKSFVKDKNDRWHRTKVAPSWLDEVHHVPGQRPGILDPGNSDSMRLHMVWYVCGQIAHLPNRFEWKKITKKLCDLPVQILVTGRRRTQALNLEYEKILVYGNHLFPNAQNLEELIVEVALMDGDLKENLWRKCWAAKTRAEIENVAKIIREMRMTLGSAGESIPIGVGGARIPKEVSLSRAGEYALKFLCTYWDIPQDSFRGVLQRITTFMQAPRNAISIRPCEFLKFCLVVAALILYSAQDNDGNPKYVRNWDVPSDSSFGQFLQTEAEECLENYFPTSACLSYYDEMGFKVMRAFLLCIFEGKVWDGPVVSAERSASFSKIMKLICPGRNAIVQG